MCTKLPFLVLLASSAAVTVACGPSMPSEEEAKTWYAAHQPAMDDFEKTILQDAGAMPWVEGGQRAPCMGSSDGGALVWEPGATKPVEKAGVDCKELNLAHKKGQEKASLRFRTATVPKAAKQAGMLVAEVRVRGKDGEPWLSAYKDEALRYPPGLKTGTKTPEQGVAVGARRLGWGAYQGDWEGYKPGIAVAWDKPLQDSTISFAVIFAAP